VRRIILRALKLTLVTFVLPLCLHAGEKNAFVLHITHVKFDYIGDKPTDSNCTKMPCTTMIITVEAHSAQIDFELQCKQGILVTDPIQNEKCWAFEAGEE
jgi:hypothetical protein